MYFGLVSCHDLSDIVNHSITTGRPVICSLIVIKSKTTCGEVFAVDSAKKKESFLLDLLRLSEP